MTKQDYGVLGKQSQGKYDLLYSGALIWDHYSTLDRARTRAGALASPE